MIIDVDSSLIEYLGPKARFEDFFELGRTSNDAFVAGIDGVRSVLATGDGKVEFILFDNKVLAYVNSAMGYPAYYPLKKVSMETPVKAVLMDLDGTSVRSEEFWIWVIQLTTASLLGNSKFELEEADIPFVSGIVFLSIWDIACENIVPIKL